MHLTRRDFLLSSGMAAAGTAIGRPIRSSIGGRQLPELEDGQGEYTASSYIQDDLVAMWDGIENAGWGMHDAEATTWRDLGGNFDLPLPSSFSVGPNYMLPSTNEGAVIRRPQSVYDAIVAGGGYTIEVVCDASESTNGTMVTVGNSNVLSIFQRSRASCIASNKYGGAGTNLTLMYSFIVDSTALNVWSVCVELGRLTTLYRNSIANNRRDSGGIAGLQYPQFVGLGINTGYPGVSTGAAGCRYHCVRIYSRALTAEEIAANYAIDKVRFNLP